MKKMITNLLTAMVVVAVMMISVPTQAQNFTNNTGGTYNATCNAVIKMKSNTSIFDGTAPLGVDKPGTIDGTVDWSSSVANQPVQARYYTNLFLSGGTKTMADGIVVVGGGTGVAGCPPALAGYDDLDNGFPYWVEGPATADYGTGEFTFDGPSGTTQNIFGDTYNDLALTDDGDKVIPTGETVDVTSITSTATTPLTVSGDLNLGADPSDLAGDITVDGGSINATPGDGPLSVNDIALLDDSSVLDFGDNTNLIISGLLDNDGDGTNLDFSCLSTVTFDGAPGQFVTPTIDSNPYGSLVLTGGNKNVGAASYLDNIYICNDFSLAGGNLAMISAADGGILYMQAVDGVVTYAANEEVVGNMNRVTDLTARPYTFNNAQTILTLAADTDNPTSMQLYVEPDANPVGYIAASDVQRKITLDYNGNAGDFEWTARAGYLEGEGPAAGAGTWPGVYTQASIRFYENGDEKLGTGTPATRGASSGATLGYVELTGIGNTATTATPNNIDVFASTNDLVLRAGPTTFYSVADGRWTNPNTWDEGTQPSAGDDAVVRHVVYAGIESNTTQAFIGTTSGADGSEIATSNTLSENGHYGALAAANNVTIIDADVTYTQPALVIGNEDNGAAYVFNFAGNLTNQNNGATAAFPFALTKAATVRTNFSGLWLINNAALTDGTNSPKMGMIDIINTGTVNNEGIIELGN